MASRLPRQGSRLTHYGRGLVGKLRQRFDQNLEQRRTREIVRMYPPISRNRRYDYRKDFTVAVNKAITLFDYMSTMPQGRGDEGYHARIESFRDELGFMTCRADRTSSRRDLHTFNYEFPGKGILGMTLELPTLKISLTDPDTGWHAFVLVKQGARQFTYYVEPASDRQPPPSFASSLVHLRSVVSRRLGGTSVLAVSRPGRPEHYRALGFRALLRWQ